MSLAYWIFCHVESVFSRDTFNINPIFWNCKKCLFKRHLWFKFNSFMILKIVECVFSKDTFHVAKTAVDLSIFSQLPFFKIAAKVKKAPRDSIKWEVLCHIFGLFSLNQNPRLLNVKTSGLSPTHVVTKIWFYFYYYYYFYLKSLPKQNEKKIIKS